MPPARRGRPAVGRAAKTTRAGQASAGTDESEKTERIQEGSVRSRGVKRPATDGVESIENQERKENKPKAGRGRPRINKAQKSASPDSGDELSEMHPETTAVRPPSRIRVPGTYPDVEIPETQQPEVSHRAATEDPTLEGALRLIGKSTAIQSDYGQNRPWESLAHRDDRNFESRIGELSRKYESLEAKYRELQETGIAEAERNFDRLKKQSEERANADKKLIATLKAQLVEETKAAKQAERLRVQLEDSQRKAEELQEKLEGVRGSLAEAQTEIKTLSTKLSAARSAESTNPKVPGSAMKGGHSNSRQLANAAEAVAQLAHKKENLYGDLTGLLVCGVKREYDEEVFDCVQTGRNGTLHFKLSIGFDGSSDKFEDARFMYMPQFDAARDRELIETLPNYLVEEITFPRLHAAKFYSRVVKALNERPE